VCVAIGDSTCNACHHYKEKKINKRVPLVLTYHPSLAKIAGIVRHHWKEIQKSETLAMLFPEPPVVAFRRPKSIKDTLVRAAVSRPSSTVGQCKPCGDKRCKCCLQLQHTQVFHSKTTGKEYKIFCNVNCKTPNVVFQFLSNDDGQCLQFSLKKDGK
jgi:hypothetical protein